MFIPRIARLAFYRFVALILSLPLLVAHTASAGFVSISASGPVGGGDTLFTGLSADPSHAYLWGALGSLAPFTIAVTVDTPGVYTVYSFRPDYIGVMGDIGKGGLVNGNGTIWVAFQYQILAASPGGSTFAAYLGATAAGLGPGPYAGFDKGSLLGTDKIVR